MKFYKPKQQLLIMMLGVPGSGKSTFARQLAQTLGFQRFSSDAVRTELYGRPDVHVSTETGERVPPDLIKKLDQETFGLLNSRVEQALLSGDSVICDHIHHGRHWRELRARQASLVKALPIMVWIKTPVDLAHKRGMSRKPQADTINETCPNSMRERINKWDKTLDPPLENEVCIEIDGRWRFEEQLSCFTNACRELEKGI